MTSNPTRAVLLLGLMPAALNAAGNPFVARYLPMGPGGLANALAVDASGNLFVAGSVEEQSGSQRIRAIKTDWQGNVLASFDFGGSAFVTGAAVDPSGNLVIVGVTYSPNAQTGFVTKLVSQLTRMLASKQIDGSANAVAVDPAGNIYVAGGTSDSSFPVTPGAFQTTPPSNTNGAFPVFAFVSEFSPDVSSIVFSTFFGSDTAACTGDCLNVAGNTSANAIAIDRDGSILVGGSTTATHLPVTAGTIGTECTSCGEPSPNRFVQSGFLAKFAPGGGKLEWATYIPLAQTFAESESTLSITSLAIDAGDNVVFAGAATSGLFVSEGALQPSYTVSNSASDYGAPFVAKVNATASGYLFSTYFGQGTYQYQMPSVALALDSQGDIWLTSGSAPGALPLPDSIALLGDSFVAELSPDGSSVIGGITAPDGAAGQAIVLSANGLPAALGSAGSLLLNLPGQPAALAGIANSAGIQVSGNVAPYELISLFGSGLGPASAQGAKIVNGALTTSLGGVQVLFDNVAAPLLYVGPSQINAIVPSSVFGQDTVSLQVITPTGTLTGPTLSVVPSEPEVFQSGPQGPPAGAAVALNQDGILNSADNPAASGSVVTVWATGAGLEAGSLGGDGIITGASLTTPQLPVSVLNASYVDVIGLDSLEVLYAGSAPGMVAGVIQVNFRLPENLRNIGQLACQLQVGGAMSSRFSIYVRQ